MTLPIYLLIMPLCFFWYALFAGMETGVMCLSRARLAHLVRAGSKAAMLLQKYTNEMQRFLASILTGTNVMSVTLSTLSASLARHLLQDYPVGQALWCFLMALITLLFCEYLPKLFFSTRPLRRTLLAVRLFYLAERLLRPLTRLILFLTQWLTPDAKEITPHPFLITRDFFHNVISDVRHGARISAFERVMINRVLTLHTHTAAQIMTPLSSVQWVTEDATLEECYELARKSGHMRLPVFSTDGGICVGVLGVLETISRRGSESGGNVADFMQKPYTVREDTLADDVLPMMRQNCAHLAVVCAQRDNRPIGIVTEEDVMCVLTCSLRNMRG